MKTRSLRRIRRPVRQATLAGVGVFLILTLAGCAVDNGTLTIPKAEVTTQASFFPLKVDGVQMELFAVKASDGTIRTALNTCQVCYDSGWGWYVQEGTQLVCQNCGNRFDVDQIEIIKNGCNPIPVTADLKTETADSIVIGAEVLAAAKPFFARWKR